MSRTNQTDPRLADRSGSADAELRARVAALQAACLGPRTVTPEAAAAQGYVSVEASYDPACSTSVVGWSDMLRRHHREGRCERVLVRTANGQREYWYRATA